MAEIDSEILVGNALESPNLASEVLSYFKSAGEAHHWSALAAVCKCWRNIIADWPITILTRRQLFYDGNALSRHNMPARVFDLKWAAIGKYAEAPVPRVKSWYEKHVYDPTGGNILISIDERRKLPDPWLPDYNDAAEYQCTNLEKLYPIGWSGVEAVKKLSRRLEVPLSMDDRWFLGHHYLYIGAIDCARAILPWSEAGSYHLGGKHLRDIGCANVVVDAGINSHLACDRGREFRTKVHELYQRFKYGCESPPAPQHILVCVAMSPIINNEPGVLAAVLDEMEADAFNLIYNWFVSWIIHRPEVAGLATVFRAANTIRPRRNRNECPDKAAGFIARSNLCCAKLLTAPSGS
ncbi:MAG: hypothetical protein WDA28_13095 [Castellaniella sp.]